MLHLATIESKTLDLLKSLQALPLFANTRLVGGTALALQLGHRKSIDIDLFGSIEDEPELIMKMQSPILCHTCLKIFHGKRLSLKSEMQ